jgi:hypothetical protein
MSADRDSSGGQATTSTVGMWNDDKTIQDLRNGEGGA